MPRDRDILQSLAQTSLFERLPEALLGEVVKSLRPVRFDNGQTIFGRGDPGAEMYFVAEGRVKISVLTSEGRELAFTHIEPGGVFGEIAMLDGGLRTADATALGQVEALSFTRAACRELMARTPAFSDAMIAFLCRRLRETDMQFEGVALHRIEVRLARYLLALCLQSAGVDSDAGAANLPNSISVTTGISQGELALLLGASRPKVNGALMLLEQDGVIRRQGDRIVCDVMALQDAAEA
ncbi:MAG: Crp/Fnr family transcriptional regulator [Hyphomicrobiaceae bacterium]